MDILITFFEGPPGINPEEDFDRVRAETEEFRISGSEMYLHSPDGYGKKKLSNNFVDRKFKVFANSWNLIGKLEVLFYG